MRLKHKKEWFEKIDQMSSLERKTIKLQCYAKPHGIFFDVETQEGLSILRQHRRIHVEDPISSALVSAGYTGKVVVCGNMSNHQMPRWLGYQLINHKTQTPQDKQRWLNSITIYTLDNVDGEVNIPVQTLHPITLTIDQIIAFNKSRSQADDYDGICFMHDGEFYHILPSRVIIGNVRSIGPNGVIAMVDLPEGKRPIRATFFGEGGPTEELIGKDVKVKYTERRGGRCINNLMSASIMQDDCFLLDKTEGYRV